MIKLNYIFETKAKYDFGANKVLRLFYFNKRLILEKCIFEDAVTYVNPRQCSLGHKKPSLQDLYFKVYIEYFNK